MTHVFNDECKFKVLISATKGNVENKNVLTIVLKRMLIFIYLYLVTTKMFIDLKKSYNVQLLNII